jgi:uncharacterized protein (TIGR02466 family)
MKLSEKIINHEIISIFPTPIYLSYLNRKLTNQELFFIDKIKLDTHKNEGNIISNDNYIINRKEFKNLKKELNLIIKDYFDKIICSANDIKPYITQSWLNYTETNQYHHKHKHANSLISGVFYINCDEKFDKIKFFKNDYNIIQPKIKEYNLWNSESWWLPVKTGNIVLFPSSLTHMVETKEGTNTRISLAFNVFIKGTLGEYEASDELKL